MTYLLSSKTKRAKPNIMAEVRTKPKELIISSSRKRGIIEARGIICYLAVNDMAYSVSEVAHALEVRRVSAG